MAIVSFKSILGIENNFTELLSDKNWQVCSCSVVTVPALEVSIINLGNVRCPLICASSCTYLFNKLDNVLLIVILNVGIKTCV